MPKKHSIETKIKISQSSKKFFPPYTKKCCGCEEHIEYKRRSHLIRSLKLNSKCRNCISNESINNGEFSKMGRRSAANQSRRSKNEILFYDLVKERFSSTIHNEKIFNGWDADIIVPELKIAVLWNGNWHRVKITKKHSVLQVQNRDKIKVDEIKRSGYTPYVIEDYGSYDEDFVRKEFLKFLEKIVDIDQSSDMVISVVS